MDNFSTSKTKNKVPTGGRGESDMNRDKENIVRLLVGILHFLVIHIITTYYVVIIYNNKYEAKLYNYFVVYNYFFHVFSVGLSNSNTSLVFKVLFNLCKLTMFSYTAKYCFPPTFTPISLPKSLVNLTTSSNIS